MGKKVGLGVRRGQRPVSPVTGLGQVKNPPRPQLRGGGMGFITERAKCYDGEPLGHTPSRTLHVKVITAPTQQRQERRHGQTG